jgi:predicted RNase H-like nuclease (RuvC/YqgF family)
VFLSKEVERINKQYHEMRDVANSREIFIEQLKKKNREMKRMLDDQNKQVSDLNTNSNDTMIDKPNINHLGGGGNRTKTFGKMSIA